MSRSFYGPPPTTDRAARLFTRGLVPVTTRLMASMSGPTTFASASGLSDGTATAAMHRLKTQATADVTDLRLMFGNSVYGAAGNNTIYVAAAVETNTPSASYPVTFSGVKELKLDADGVAISDPVSIPVKKGDTLWLRTYVRVGTLGEKWPISVHYWQSGDAVTADADLTSGTGTTGFTAPLLGNATTVYGFAPAAVLGAADTTVPVVGLWGDSITVGVGNDPSDLYQSWAEYALAGQVPWFNLSRHNENLGSMTPIPANGLTTFTPVAFRQKMRLAQGCTHIVSSYGANDFIIGGMTLSVMQANYISHWAALAGRGLKVRQTTLIPRNTSTDNWLTLGNQTVNANEAVRVAVNAWIRDGAPILNGAAVAVGSNATGTQRAGMAGHPLVGVIETADTVESARDSGKWRAPTTVVTDAAITSGQKVLTSATAGFTPAHVGQRVSIAGAGASGAVLSTVIRTYTSATTVSVVNAASTTVSGATCGIGVYSSDGTHPARTGHLAMATAINPAIFTT